MCSGFFELVGGDGVRHDDATVFVMTAMQSFVTRGLQISGPCFDQLALRALLLRVLVESCDRLVLWRSELGPRPEMLRGVIALVSPFLLAALVV